MAIRQRWRDKNVLLDFMRAMELAAIQAEQAAKSAGIGGKLFYNGVRCAVQECKREGQSMAGWGTDTNLGQGYDKAWALLRLAASGVANGIGVPPVVLPPFFEEDRQDI
jgi:hypothetical protein